MTRLAVAVLALCLIGCGDDPRPTATASNGCKIKDYGMGVYYFDCSDNFGPALAEFRKSHVVVTITSYTSLAAASMKTGTSGYWVVTEVR